MRAKVIAVLFFFFFSVSSAQASTQKVLYTFTGGNDGGQPYAGVIFDTSGNLYGVTQTGGLYNRGTVFELSPTKSGSWTETVIYNFTGGTDGDEPVGGLAIDSSGNLYGTAIAGGDPKAQCGTVFELSPSPSGWTFTLLHSFQGGTKDGCAPMADLSVVWDEGEYRWVGTTTAGGTKNLGTAFEEGGFTWSFRGTNGGQPAGGVNAWGYGAAYGGGSLGGGTVYYLSYGNRVLVVHSFKESKEGVNPMGELLAQTVGGVSSMYGTTSFGGASRGGTVYRLTESQTRPNVWACSVLHSFSGPDGDGPAAGLIMDSTGNLFGTTSGGGSGGAGTVFKLTPGAKNKWTQTVLYNFTGGNDGGSVYSGVVFDNSGNLYGTTLKGGAQNQGVVYEVTP